MLRPYASGTADDIEAFYGLEVEHTPAHLMPTLFIVNRLPISRVSELVDESQNKHGTIKHLFFGANWSFDGEDVGKWADLIRYFLREGFWCTLDFRPAHIPLVQKSGLCKHAKFIPLIGVRMPSVFALGVNATLKIDDTSFAGTNRGVWCVPLRKLVTDESLLTEWSAYSNDSIL